MGGNDNQPPWTMNFNMTHLNTGRDGNKKGHQFSNMHKSTQNIPEVRKNQQMETKHKWDGTAYTSFSASRNLHKTYQK